MEKNFKLEASLPRYIAFGRLVGAEVEGGFLSFCPAVAWQPKQTLVSVSHGLF